MADKSISELVAATAVGSTDLFVLEQTGTAKKLTGQILENWLVAMADGHGGIQSITKTAESGLVDTYTVLLADTTTYTFTVTNGKAISSITQYWAASDDDTTVPSQWYTTRQSLTSSNRYLWSYMTFAYNDGTTEDTTKTVVGVYGDTGDQTYVWIRYASVMPTSDEDIGTNPDDYIGIYVGLSSTAPTHYMDYDWYRYKGETGDPAVLQADDVTYQASNSGTTIPSGTWTAEVPYVTPGEFLWTKVVLTWSESLPVTYYTVSRYGVDGAGSAGTATPLSDSTDGAVGESTSFSRQDHRHPLPVASDIVLSSGHTVQADVSELLTFEALHITGTVSSNSLYINDSRITSDMRVLECVWGTPRNVTSDITWTTSDGGITFSNGFSGQTTVDLILGKTN